MLSEKARKNPTLSNGPSQQVDKDPPAPSTLPAECDKPDMKARSAEVIESNASRHRHGS